MAAKKKESERRDTRLGIRLTAKERKTLARVAKRFAPMDESAVARHALMRGLEVIESEGIAVPTPGPWSDT